MTRPISPRRSRRRSFLLSKLRHTRRRASVALLTLVVIVCASATAFAQLDPLLFVKRVPPTVIVIFDTSLRMLDDGAGNVYDPNFYSTTADAPVMGAFPNINTGTTKTYRRVYRNFQYDNMLGGRTSPIASPRYPRSGIRRTR